MSRERFVRNENGAVVSLITQRVSDKRVEHIRHFRENLTPAMERTKMIAEESATTSFGKNYGYIGSIPRIVLHDWLIKQGKTWHQYATDNDLKDKFLKWFRTSRSMTKFQAATYRGKRSGGAVSRPTAPSLGSQILNDYRKETGMV